MIFSKVEWSLNSPYLNCVFFGKLYDFIVFFTKIWLTGSVLTFFNGELYALTMNSSSFAVKYQFFLFEVRAEEVKLVLVIVPLFIYPVRMLVIFFAKIWPLTPFDIALLNLHNIIFIGRIPIFDDLRKPDLQIPIIICNLIADSDTNLPEDHKESERIIAVIDLQFINIEHEVSFSQHLELRIPDLTNFHANEDQGNDNHHDRHYSTRNRHLLFAIILII